MRAAAIASPGAKAQAVGPFLHGPQGQEGLASKGWPRAGHAIMARGTPCATLPHLRGNIK